MSAPREERCGPEGKTMWDPREERCRNQNACLPDLLYLSPLPPDLLLRLDNPWIFFGLAYLGSWDCDLTQILLCLHQNYDSTHRARWNTGRTRSEEDGDRFGAQSDICRGKGLVISYTLQNSHHNNSLQIIPTLCNYFFSSSAGTSSRGLLYRKGGR